MEPIAVDQALSRHFLVGLTVSFNFFPIAIMVNFAVLTTVCVIILQDKLRQTSYTEDHVCITISHHMRIDRHLTKKCLLSIVPEDCCTGRKP